MYMALAHARRLLVFIAAGFSLCTALAAQPENVAGDTSQDQSLIFVYEAPASAELQDLVDTLRESRILESWTGYVNRILGPLSRQIEAAFVECGEANSRYEVERQRIILCYEEADRSFGILKAIGYESEPQLLTAWVGSMLHQFYHELAHALIDMLALPVLGREEDGADQFAVIALLGYHEGWLLVLGAADYFYELAGIENELGLDPARHHAFFSQRYYSLLCLTYGSDPAKHELLVTQGRLPEKRAASCRAEYLRAAYGWGKLLEK